MMDDTAIKQIQESASIPELQAMVAENSSKPAAILPPGYSLVDLEEYNDQASHFSLVFATPMVADFLSYCKNNAQDHAKCFVNPETMSATTIFDLGTKTSPGHKKHRAKLSLKRTAALNAICSIVAAGQIKQQALSDFLLDWEDLITVRDTQGITMSVDSAAARVRDLTIETAKSATSKVGDMGHEMSAMEKIEAAKKDTIPGEIVFECQPYHGLDVRRFRVKVAVLVGQSIPMLKLRFVAFEEAEEQMADEMKTKIVVGLVDTKIMAHIGSV